MRAMTVHLDDDSRTDEAPPPQTTVFETDAQLKEHLDRTPASLKQLIVRFGIGAIAALTLVSMFTAFASRRVGTQQAIKDARIATSYIAREEPAPGRVSSTCSRRSRADGRYGSSGFSGSVPPEARMS